MNFGAIRYRLRRQFGDDFGGRFGDTDIVNWINDAQREIALGNNLLQKAAYITLVEGENKYALPNDILLLHSIAYNGEPIKGLGLKEFQDLNRDTEGRITGPPSNFTIWAGQLWINPYPVDMHLVPANQLHVFYTRYPIDVTGSDSEEPIDLPPIYQNRVLEYCLAQASEMDEDREGYALKMQEFQVGVANTKDETDWFQRDQYDVITAVPEDYDHFYQGVFW